MLNDIANKVIKTNNGLKKQNIIANQKLNIIANKTINANIKHTK